jgi:hypothetical protein
MEVLNNLNPTSHIPYFISFHGTHASAWAAFETTLPNGCVVPVIPDDFPVEELRGKMIVCGEPHFLPAHGMAIHVLRIIRWAMAHPESVYEIFNQADGIGLFAR